jgi:hypothetical protein
MRAHAAASHAPAPQRHAAAASRNGRGTCGATCVASATNSGLSGARLAVARGHEEVVQHELEAALGRQFCLGRRALERLWHAQVECARRLIAHYCSI